MAAVAARLGVACAAVTLAVAGCGSDTETAPNDAAAVLRPAVTVPEMATAPPIADSTVLDASLLTAAELPPGYASLDVPTDPDDGATEDPPADQSHTDPAECAGVLAPIADQAPGGVAQAGERFGGPEFSSIDIDAASYPADRVAAVFDSVQQLLGRCTAYSGTDADGIAVEYRVADLDRPSVGDASRAVRVTTTSDGLTLASDVVIGVVGSTVFQLSATATSPVDAATLTGLAQTQADRLRGPAQ